MTILTNKSALFQSSLVILWNNLFMNSGLGLPLSSVTRLGDLLEFGQLFKACGNN